MIINWHGCWFLYRGLTGTSVLAYTLGLRHALDADHIVVRNYPSFTLETRVVEPRTTLLGFPLSVRSRKFFNFFFRLRRGKGGVFLQCFLPSFQRREFWISLRTVQLLEFSRYIIDKALTEAIGYWPYHKKIDCIWTTSPYCWNVF